MLAHYQVNNVTTISPRLVKGVLLEHLVAAGESESSVGKGFADEGSDTSVTSTGWRPLHQTKHSALIQGFSDDILIVSAVTVLDLPNGDSVILQAHESIHLPNNNDTILSHTQMRKLCVEINDKAKRHNGFQNIIVEDKEIPLKFKRGLLDSLGKLELHVASIVTMKRLKPVECELRS